MPSALESLAALIQDPALASVPTARMERLRLHIADTLGIMLEGANRRGVVHRSGGFDRNLYKFIGHRTTDIRHLTVLAVVNFFTGPIARPYSLFLTLCRSRASICE